MSPSRDKITIITEIGRKIILSLSSSLARPGDGFKQPTSCPRGLPIASFRKAGLEVAGRWMHRK